MVGPARPSRLALLLAALGPLSWSSLARAQAEPASPTTPGGASEPAAPPAQPPPTNAPNTAPAPRRGNLLPTQPTAADPGAAGTAGAAGAVNDMGEPSARPAQGDGAMPPIDPARDQRDLAAQGADRPTNDGSIGARPSDVFSEDWWGRARPVLELHGFFRTRSELLHNFALGRNDPVGAPPYLWPRPDDDSYTPIGGTPRDIQLCDNNSRCQNRSQAGANMRFRLNPELHISDNLRVLSQIDALDNLVLGSTPDSFAWPGRANTTGYDPANARSGNPYAAQGWQATTQGPPTAGVNGYRNSIDVKRAWAEYMTPLGQVRFGRMPFHWGLGMQYNAGDGFDSDWQTTYDRIQFVSGVRSLDLYAGGSWDFMNTGPTSATPYDVYGFIPYNTANLVNVNQWSLFLARRKNPELQRSALARGEVVVNGGVLAQYRTQYLDTANTALGLERRGLYQLSPDIWLQLLYQKFRFEAEIAAHWGSVEAIPGGAAGQDVKIRQFAFATQTEYRAVEDKLRLNFGVGWASGNEWEQSLNPGFNAQGGFQPQLNGRGPLSTFRFHPDYRIDLIFWRRIMTRVQGAYYFRPSVDYDFVKHANGQRFGGGAAIIWSRASQFIQTPGHKRDLGLELNVQLYYQSKDGSLNDEPNRMGGFFTALQYGVFFPLGGLGYLPGEVSAGAAGDTSSAQTLRLLLGVLF